MRGLLLALAAVPEPYVFVEGEIAVAFVFHPPNVAGADAVILQPHQLFDGEVAVAEFFEFLDEIPRSRRDLSSVPVLPVATVRSRVLLGHL